MQAGSTQVLAVRRRLSCRRGCQHARRPKISSSLRGEGLGVRDVNQILHLPSRSAALIKPDVRSQAVPSPKFAASFKPSPQCHRHPHDRCVAGVPPMPTSSRSCGVHHTIRSNPAIYCAWLAARRSVAVSNAPPRVHRSSLRAVVARYGRRKVDAVSCHVRIRRITAASKSPDLAGGYWAPPRSVRPRRPADPDFRVERCAAR